MFPIDHLHTAFARVQQNHGCPGCDGISIANFEQGLQSRLEELSAALASGRYAALPLLRFPVPKRHGKGSRFLSVPTVRDRVAQTAIMMAVYPFFEAECEDCSWAYRPNRSWQKALYEVKNLRDAGYHWVVDADIDAFFDSVDHDLLFARLTELFGKQLPALSAAASDLPPVAALLALFEQWIRAEVYDGERIWRLERGIPQGSVVSPSLANLFLDKLDEELQSLGIKIVRYADDFLLLAKTQAGAEEALELTDLVLDDLDLKLDEAEIVPIERGLTFLGAYISRTSILVPLAQQKPPAAPIDLPPPLSLQRYLELKRL